MNGRRPLLTVPAPLIRGLGWLSEALLSDPVITWEVAVQGTLHSVFDARRVPEELGVPYTPFEETLEKTRRWLTANGHLKPI